MKHMLCASVGRVLEAYHDGELPIDQQIAVESHVSECALCASQAKSLRMVRDALRATADTTPDESWTPAQIDASLNGMAAAVISRVKAERQQSLPVRVARAFEDMHLVWAALAATTATATCAAVVAGVLYFAPKERDDSLAGLMAALAAPVGSDRNPMMLDNRVSFPRFESDKTVPMVPSTADADESFAISGVLTQEGRVAFPSLLSSSYSSEANRSVMDAMANARFEPAMRGGAPVAVNLVYVFERTTVKGKSS